MDLPIIPKSALRHGLTEDEILAHANDLAARFENYIPNPKHELGPAAMSELCDAVAQQSDAERHLVAAVSHARKSGMTWANIGRFVGTTGESARQRHGNRVP
jgi:hypothetical protein